jgi:hypothetical protein
MVSGMGISMVYFWPLFTIDTFELFPAEYGSATLGTVVPLELQKKTTQYSYPQHENHKHPYIRGVNTIPSHIIIQISLIYV